MSGISIGEVTVSAAATLLDEAKTIIRDRQRKIAIDRYMRERERLLALRSNRETLARRFAGVELPEISIEEPPARNIDVEEIERLTDRLRVYAGGLSEKIEQALMRYHQENLASQSVEELSTWIKAIKVPGLRTVEDLGRAFDPDGVVGSMAAQDARLAQARDNARKMIDDLPACPGHVIGAPTLKALQAVLEATDESRSQMAMEQLRDVLNMEREEIRAQLLREADLERIRELEEEQLVQLAITEKLRNTLEDMGYRVSSIDSTAYVDNGKIYAFDQDYPDHAQIFEISRDGKQVKSTPARIVEEYSDYSDLDQRNMREEDAEYDRRICDSQLIALKNRFGSDAASIRFTAGAVGGQDGNVVHIPEEEIEEDIRALRKRSRSSQPLKERTRS